MDTTPAGLSPALLHVTPSAVVAMDTEGRITMLNAAAERLFGQSAQKAAGAGIRATALGELCVKGRKKPVDAFAVEALAA